MKTLKKSSLSCFWLLLMSLHGGCSEGDSLSGASTAEQTRETTTSDEDELVDQIAPSEGAAPSQGAAEPNTSFEDAEREAPAPGDFAGDSGSEPSSESIGNEDGMDDAELSGAGLCPLISEGQCFTTQADVCALRTSWEGFCTDADGDCFVVDCTDDLEPSVKALMEGMLDCDDFNADSNLFGLETCDDRDQDCDRRVDEGFNKGAACEACGMRGVFECDVDNPTRNACSIQAGQSQAMDPLPDETCDGVDEDCDGFVDEKCALLIETDLAIRHPAVCGERIMLAAENSVIAIAESQAEVRRQTLAETPGPVTHITCENDTELAFLVLGGNGECAVEPFNLLHCGSTVWAQTLGSEARVLHPALGSWGPPLVSQGIVYWHSLGLSGSRQLLSKPLADGELTTPFGSESLTDPTPVIDDEMVVRSWAEGSDSPGRIVLRNLSDGRERRIDSPDGVAGPPVRNENWTAWSFGEADSSIWAVPNSDLVLGGFQPIIRPGRHISPRLSGDTLIWLESNQDRQILRSFNLLTGVERTLAEANIDPNDIAVGEEIIVWLETEEIDSDGAGGAQPRTTTTLRRTRTGDLPSEIPAIAIGGNDEIGNDGGSMAVGGRDTAGGNSESEGDDTVSGTDFPGGHGGGSEAQTLQGNTGLGGMGGISQNNSGGAAGADFGGSPFAMENSEHGGRASLEATHGGASMLPIGGID